MLPTGHHYVTLDAPMSTIIPHHHPQQPIGASHTGQKPPLLPQRLAPHARYGASDSKRDVSSAECGLTPR